MEKLAQVAVLCRAEGEPQRQEYVMHTALKTEQVFKGKAEGQLSLRQSVEEEPLSPGRYILFLEEREDNQGTYYYLCCGRQGIFRLEDERMIAQDPAMDDEEMQSWAQVYLPQEPPATAGQRAAWLAGLLAPVLAVLTLSIAAGKIKTKAPSRGSYFFAGTNGRRPHTMKRGVIPVVFCHKCKFSVNSKNAERF